jgi:hypothetical protein
MGAFGMQLCKDSCKSSPDPGLLQSPKTLLSTGLARIREKLQTTVPAL